jgi:DNA polymerase-3 subunit delta'
MNMSNDLWPWHQPAWTQLCRYRAEGRVPHALLILGPYGLGNEDLAERFAAALLCKNAGANETHCGRCASCLLLQSATHPDHKRLQPDEAGKPITIAHIRQLLDDLTLKPQFGGFRTVIVNPANAMTHAAANAFLKGLEEPPPQTVMLLLTDRLKALPATIVSRCQKLIVAIPDRALQLRWLKQQAIQGDLDILISLAQGAPLLAQQFADPAVLMQRRRCFDNWLALTDGQAEPAQIAQDWLKVPEKFLIFWLLSWLVDLTRCRYHCSEQQLFNPDLAKPLQELAKRLDLKKVYGWYDTVLLSKERLETSLNKQCLWEDLLIQWFTLSSNKRNDRSGASPTSSGHIVPVHQR